MYIETCYSITPLLSQYCIGGGGLTSNVYLEKGQRGDTLILSAASGERPNHTSRSHILTITLVCLVCCGRCIGAPRPDGRYSTLVEVKRQREASAPMTETSCVPVVSWIESETNQVVTESSELVVSPRSLAIRYSSTTKRKMKMQ